MEQPTNLFLGQMENVSQGFRQYLFRDHLTSTFTILGSIVCLFLAMVYFFAGHADTGGFFTVLFITFGLVAAYGAWVYKKIRQEFYRQFAQNNNFSYLKKGWETGLHGTLFSLGHSQVQEDIIKGEVNSKKITLVNFTFVTGSGKSQQTHRHTALEIEFDQILPPALLKPDWDLSPISPWFPNAKKINLEGDFESSFNLYTRDNFEVETLQIFNQEFLALAKDKWRKFSLEFKEKELYVYSGHIITTRLELYALLEMASYIAQKFGQKLPTLQSSLNAMREITSGQDKPKNLNFIGIAATFAIAVILLFLAYKLFN